MSSDYATSEYSHEKNMTKTHKKYDIPYDISTIYHNVFKNVEITMFFRNKVDQEYSYIPYN